MRIQTNTSKHRDKIGRLKYHNPAKISSRSRRLEKMYHLELDEDFEEDWTEEEFEEEEWPEEEEEEWPEEEEDFEEEEW
ncbi:MAG: hypothetical protein N3D12_05690 [Candidatus Methanomethyliaceae archaeon]|nr:hypothetical protein [Candidatus Methanomethyliaceae archaeon]